MPLWRHYNNQLFLLYVVRFVYLCPYYGNFTKYSRCIHCKIFPGPLSIAENLSSQNNDSDTEPEPQSPTQQVFENKNLVITIKDALKENNENNTIGDDTNDKVSSRNPHNRPRHPDRNHSNKIKNSESKKDVSRLTTRSMKPVFALWTHQHAVILSSFHKNLIIAICSVLWFNKLLIIILHIMK